MMLNDIEDVNAILADLAEQRVLEPMVEPIDEPTCHPMDWAEVTGLADELADEIYPEADWFREECFHVDTNGIAWYIH